MDKVHINPVASAHHVSCDVCHRTMLKGEQAEPYLTPSRERRLVCQLCAPRAQAEGWIREAAAPEMPARPQRQPERRGLLRRRRRPDDAAADAPPAPIEDESRRGRAAGDLEEAEGAPLRGLMRRSRPRSPRQVKAVPTNAQLKIERALELFNTSAHARTVAGIARTLGAPRAGAVTSRQSAAEVVLTVAWELSWYQFNVDLSDGREPVRLRGQGHELSELPEDSRDWNCEVGEDGSLSLGGAGNGEAPAGDLAGGESSGEQEDAHL
jgi:hypothetical protein